MAWSKVILLLWVLRDIYSFIIEKPDTCAMASWCMQNLCMNFVVYWCIFQHIKMLLVVIIMFFIDLWGFSLIPFILVITLYDRKTLFCVFWHFRNLPELNLTWDLSGINILSREPSRAQEVNEGGHEDQTSIGSAGPSPDRATRCRLALGHPMPSLFVPDCSAWPKNDYIKTPPRRSLEEATKKHKIEKQRNKGCSNEDWRRKHCRSPRSLLQHLRHHHHIEEGIVHLWTMGLWQ
jgi:hypothetical protein